MPNPIDWTRLTNNGPTTNYNNRPYRYNIRTTPGSDVAGNYVNVNYPPKSNGNSFGANSLGNDYKTSDYWGFNKSNENIATPPSYNTPTDRDIDGNPTITGINNNAISVYTNSNGTSYTPAVDTGIDVYDLPLSLIISGSGILN